MLLRFVRKVRKDSVFLGVFSTLTVNIGNTGNTGTIPNNGNLTEYSEH